VPGRLSDQPGSSSKRSEHLETTRPSSEAGLERSREVETHPVRTAVLLAVTTVVVGGLCGWLWPAVTQLPGYTVQADHTAFTTERGLTQFINGDISYAAIGLVVGAGLGLIAWRAYGRSLGWPVVPIGIAAALLAGVLCWFIGGRVGPHNFDQRLAAAQPGDVVSIDLQLRSAVAIVVWALGACVPMLGITALAGDPDPGRPFHLPWSARTSTADVGVSGSGDRDEISGGEPDLQSAPSRRHHDGSEAGG